MEPAHLTDSSDVQSHLISAFVPPTLREEEYYHVFLSYSSTDYRWTHALVDRLEAAGLQVCYHERDFIPGRTILENMSECIQQSQKVLLVLSAEFVCSRWCLLEANMSLFRDCLERKPIIPVLLEPEVCVSLCTCVTSPTSRPTTPTSPTSCCTCSAPPTGSSGGRLWCRTSLLQSTTVKRSSHSPPPTRRA
ncbi:toll-like receptor 1 [Boleophthalmus pectinirostris]|uniref:toll-like receptor 1 n=1 Tax=Boleophthalmus pectinirostris TaxID=150288 RepID=UPI00242F7185|nr:toll-like receptor 1 [Boleophthalmus pectinirostris]XP_055011789.1 toll-like receptor 1 [Boleophthalmus pectinirostris]